MATLPSTLLNLKNELLAWQFDEALFLWGRHVDNQLDACKNNDERKRKLERLLADGKLSKSRPIDIGMFQMMGGVKVKDG